MHKLLAALYLALICVVVPDATWATNSARESAPGGCEPDELFMNLLSDETWRATIALTKARSNLKANYPVTILLDHEGVRVALKENAYAQDVFAKTGLKPRAILKQVLRLGARVIVCPGCLDRAGFEPHELIRGVYLGGPTTEILHCSTVQLTY